MLLFFTDSVSIVCTFCKKKSSQESEFCGGQVGEPEIFFSTGKTILERFVFRRLISTNAF